MKRVTSIDIARGLVMLIMTLDHSRDLLHVDALTQNPTNLATTTPLLFFTRWITHLCAPAFVFLSGVSAWLSIGREREGATRRMLTRGLWLIFLFMALVEERDNAFLRVLSVYGKVPLFYYLIHWYVLHSLLFAMVFLQGYPANALLFGPFQFGRPAKGSGLPLWGVYAVWLSVVSALYPLCRWYARYKAAHKEKGWLRYL